MNEIPMNESCMKEIVCKLVRRHLPEFTKEEILNFMEVPPSLELGDFSLPCFAMENRLKKAPMKIAEEVKQGILLEGGATVLLELKAVNGYLNFYLQKEMVVEQVITSARRKGYGALEEGKGKVVCIDYSSPNIAKNFHVGHLRTTIIGNSLYKIYKTLGYQVVRINYLGDWGTQFGKLIVAYKKWSSKEEVEEKGIAELLRIYVLFNVEAKRQPELVDQARAWFVKMEQGEEEAHSIWTWFKEISMIEFDRIYKVLGVEFDCYTGESFYMDKVPALVEELKEKNLLCESQRATIIDLEEYHMPPCLITKRDGGSIYHSRDIAALLYRKKQYQFDQCIYVTGMEQQLHFAQVFKVIELMGYEWHQTLVHVPYGLVSLEGAKLSSRNGNILYAEEILAEAMKRAAELIEQKNPSLEEKESVAHMVGIGAVMFHDLYNQRMKNVNFSWEEILNYEGETGPYVQYTYARAKSILCKVGSGIVTGGISFQHLTDDASYILIKKIALYPEKIREAAKRYEPSVVARYLIELSSAFNKFYHECNIMNAEKEVQEARLVVVDLTQRIIKGAMGLLGIECPEEM